MEHEPLLKTRNNTTGSAVVLIPQLLLASFAIWINCLLLHCFVSSLWELIFFLVVVPWVFPKGGEGGPSLLDRVFCWEKGEEDLEVHPSLHL